MPLGTCPDCGRQVSTIAPSCPQCGRPHPAATPSRPPPATQPDSGGSKLLVGGLVLFGFLLMVGVCNQSNSPASSRSANVDSTSTMSALKQVPAVSREDSLRFRQRVREIVRAHSPTGWAEAEQSRMNSLAD